MRIGRRYNTPGRIMALAVVACFAWAALLFMQQAVFFKNSVEADARVARSGSGAFGVRRIVQVEYVLNNGVAISARIPTRFPHAEGQHVRIAYNPKHPGEARFSGNLEVHWRAVIIFLLGGLLFVADCGRRIWNRRNR